MIPTRAAVRLSSPWLIEPLAVCTGLALVASWFVLLALPADQPNNTMDSVAYVTTALLALLVVAAWSLLLALEVSDLGRERQSRRWLLPLLQAWAGVPLAVRLLGAYLLHHGVDNGLAGLRVDAELLPPSVVLFVVLVLGFVGKCSMRLVEVLGRVTEAQRLSLWSLGASLPRTGWWVLSARSPLRVLAAFHLIASEMLLDAAAISWLVFDPSTLRPLVVLAVLTWASSHYSIWRAQRE